MTIGSIGAHRRDKVESAMPRARDKVRLERLNSRSDAEVGADRQKLHPTGKKECSRCESNLPFAAFHQCRANPDGLRGHCGECSRKDIEKSRNQKRKRSPAALSRDLKRMRPDGTKWCRGCDKTLPVSEFCLDMIQEDGKHPHCRKCKSEIVRKECAIRMEMRDEKRSPGCAKCGEKNVRCIDLHHSDPSTKYRNDAGKHRSPAQLKSNYKLKLELELLVPLCANCHSDETRREQLSEQKRRADAGIKMTAAAERQKQVVQELRAFVNAEKAKRGFCVDCKLEVGDRFHGFDFDHVRGEKIEAVSRMASLRNKYSRQEIACEMSKCDLRCKNCHRLSTYAKGQYSWQPAPEDPDE
jgi:hypothetical protein